ncbi:hypothetical protein [Streptomyces sp. HD]|uniref:hypothetical protein n=1 Tax=Streptomyces sp. HD TaxID=3020892 RepID=UPI00232AE2C2|nr:hypothetical protein [Streptomyces sp. HD]MDC0773645.1 hypothetical protein [Streptomyces sp. HD]
MEWIACLSFEGELRQARSVLERGEPLVHGGLVLDSAGLPRAARPYSRCLLAGLSKGRPNVTS